MLSCLVWCGTASTAGSKQTITVIGFVAHYGAVNSENDLGDYAVLYSTV